MTCSAPSTLFHQVEWRSLPPSLRPQKISSLAWNVFSLFIFPIALIRLAGAGAARLARRCILPSSAYKKELHKLADTWLNLTALMNQAAFESITATIQTPDRVFLKAHLFRHRHADRETPTTICFGGNGELKGFPSGYTDILSYSTNRNRPMNVLIFDYRSVSHSTAKYQVAKDLIIDGLSLVDFVRKKIGTPDEKIHFYGFSLGGAIALKTKAADRKLTGRLIHSSSFATLGDVVMAQAMKISFLLKPFAYFVKWFLRAEELELDAVADLPLVTGKKMILFHPQDPIIPYEASLAIRCVNDQFAYEGPPSHQAPFEPRVAEFLFGVP